MGWNRAVHDGLVTDAHGLRTWLAALIELRLGLERRGAVRRGVAARASGGDLDELAELAEALAGSRERHARNHAAGRGIPRGRSEWLAACGPRTSCPPIAPMRSPSARRPVRMALPLEPALAVFLQAFAANLAQAAIRLGVTGQNGAVSVIAALEADTWSTPPVARQGRHSTISARQRSSPKSCR